jgi:hypothetical protein
VSVRPALNGQGEMAWVCGNAKMPRGYTVAGDNRTTMKSSGLPRDCE